MKPVSIYGGKVWGALLFLACLFPVHLYAAPTVSSVVPANNATGIATNTTAKITFSAVMNSATVTTSSFYVLDPYGNQVATNAPVKSNTTTNPKTFTITPTSILSNCVTYQINVTPTVKDKTGVAMGGTVNWTSSFKTVTTGTAPAVAATVPASGATSVVESLPLTLSFTQLLDNSTIGPTIPTTFTLEKTSDGTAVPGITTLTSPNNNTLLTFTPTSNLENYTQYTARISSAAKNYCGTALSNYSWSFTTRDTIAPYVTSTSPVSASGEISINAPIVINFSEAMQAVTSSNISVVSGATTVSGSVAFDTTSNMTATFTPTTPLSYNTTYTVAVSNARDLGGSNTMMPNPFTFTFTTTPKLMDRYCSLPPSVVSNITPNILMILDNSQSMDEDFNGNAVGSYHSSSKSVNGKKALQSVVNEYVNVLRLGLMTYNLPSSAKQFINNSPYFASYDPISWCPVPPQECSDYCVTGDATSQSTCRTTCQAQNPSFDETYMDEVIANRTPGDALRTKYCNLVYPKTQRMVNPTDTANYVYYKQALPYYTNANPGNQFNYAQNYHFEQEITNTATSTDGYDVWTGKTGTSDTYVGYNGGHFTSAFVLTDSDLAAGYGNIGRRNTSYPVGRTWFANSSPGGGYLQVAINSNDGVNTQKNLLINKLAAYESNETGYMSCTNTGNPNACSYIVNAGLTPTAGTLKSAYDYFSGSSSPIQYRCQKNFIIYVTDGLPSVGMTGSTGSAATLMGDDTTPATGTVLKQIDNLRALSKTISSQSYTFDVKTYVLGVGLGQDARTYLEQMAVHGGSLQAFYANNATQLSDALRNIMIDILQDTSSGSAASVANNKSGERGVNIVQSLFYPQWYVDNSVKWLGETQALWYYLDPIINYSDIREDTDGNREFNLKLDKQPPADSFNTKAIWKAGVELHKRSATSRSIYTLLSTSSRELTNADNVFSTAQRTALKPLLNAASLTNTQTDSIINYVRGVDDTLFRPRTVEYEHSSPTGVLSDVWKLGDVVNSTPQVQGSIPINNFHTQYADTSYKTYVGSSQYLSRNVVYSGANDGMLHAFRLGKVTELHDVTQPFRIAKIVDTTDLGKEEWGFIPKNALPYLQHTCDLNYCHQYLVDGPLSLFDASVYKHSACLSTNYWECTKQAKLVGGAGTDKNDLVPATTSWRTVLIGGMGLGGATRDGNCNETLAHDANPANNTDCVKIPLAGQGFSSYFALDITNPLAPKQLWEFSDADIASTTDKGLGFTVSGAEIVRINAQIGSPAKPDKSKNGRWFAVFASGPTGSVDASSRKFTGRSDQNLKVYVVDVNAFDTTTTFTKGTNYWVFDTGIPYAFSNSILGGGVDLDRADSTLSGYYSDDVVYITYTKASLDGSSYPLAWDKGGVVRLVTKNDPDPANWFVSTLIDNIGPVTSSIDKLQDRTNHKLWIYFGEGRFFYQGDDMSTQRRIFGIADPCYGYDASHLNTLASTAASCSAVSLANLKNQTNTPTAALGVTDKGWYINLDTATGSKGAERVITDVSAQKNGVVFYATYIPDSDPCEAEGTASLWAVQYKTGGTPSSSAMKGKIPLQTSIGTITMVNLASNITDNGGRKLDASVAPRGMPPKGKFTTLKLPKPVKQIINFQER